MLAARRVLLLPRKAAQIFSFAFSRDGRPAYSRGFLASDVVLITETE